MPVLCVYPRTPDSVVVEDPDLDQCSVRFPEGDAVVSVEKGKLALVGQYSDYASPVAERDSRGNPVAEFVSCVNCSSSAPVGLVWRVVSNGVRDVLLEYPDLLMDALAIWNPCPKLTVLVTSEPGLRAQRDAIRTTWGAPGSLFQLQPPSHLLYERGAPFETALRPQGLSTFVVNCGMRV
ncbi:hypothetical protein MRX96_032760 [Rhipicephalus microplus]